MSEPPQEKVDAIRNLAEQWFELFRKLVNRKLRTEDADIVTSAIMNFLAMVFVELISKFDVGFHDKLFQDFIGLVKHKYDEARPEPKSRIITLN